MVIGNGMIAKEFSSYNTKDDFIIFASGVSDSIHADPVAYKREEKLLADTIRSNNNKTLVYFSTCSIYDDSRKSSSYVKHKLDMEAMIIQEQKDYVIFRLSNPVGKTSNSTTIINYLVNHIVNKQVFEIWNNASRNIIDIDHMYTVCNEILATGLFRNRIVNIANPQNYSLPVIVKNIEAHFNITANYTLVNKGGGPVIDVSGTIPLFKKFNINFGDDYLTRLLQKYFPA